MPVPTQLAALPAPAVNFGNLQPQLAALAAPAALGNGPSFGSQLAAFLTEAGAGVASAQ